MGSESTGKTTLARRLAEHYDVEWVPEFVRDYADRKRTPLAFDDHAPIAHGQLALEDEYRVRSAERDAPLLLQDTDLLSTAVYCTHYYGRCPIWLSDAARARRPDLYLLLDIDLPWIPDPQRDRGHMREEMQSLFRQAVEQSGVRFVVIRGDAEARFAAARAAIDDLLNRNRDRADLTPQSSKLTE
jgi:NadR type nicotinamide-nucleotide adenylyltransferase